MLNITVHDERSGYKNTISMGYGIIEDRPMRSAILQDVNRLIDNAVNQHTEVDIKVTKIGDVPSAHPTTD